MKSGVNDALKKGREGEAIKCYSIMSDIFFFFFFFDDVIHLFWVIVDSTKQIKKIK